jgi:hypothetical protein
MFKWSHEPPRIGHKMVIGEAEEAVRRNRIEERARLQAIRIQQQRWELEEERERIRNVQERKYQAKRPKQAEPRPKRPIKKQYAPQTTETRKDGTGNSNQVIAHTETSIEVDSRNSRWCHSTRRVGTRDPEIQRPPGLARAAEMAQRSNIGKWSLRLDSWLELATHSWDKGGRRKVEGGRDQGDPIKMNQGSLVGAGQQEAPSPTYPIDSFGNHSRNASMSAQQTRKIRMENSDLLWDSPSG